MSVSDKKSCTSADEAIARDIYAFCMAQKQTHFTIPYLAKKAGVSPTKLKQIFRAIYGTSLFAYIRAEKMHWACRQLIRPDLHIIDIAEACGYDNASKFSAAFRAVIGCSPREFRRKNVRLE